MSLYLADVEAGQVFKYEICRDWTLKTPTAPPTNCFASAYATVGVSPPASAGLWEDNQNSGTQYGFYAAVFSPPVALEAATTYYIQVSCNASW